MGMVFHEKYVMISLLEVGCVFLEIKGVTSSKHNRHTQAMELYLEVATDAVKDFKLRKYNIWPFNFMLHY